MQRARSGLTVMISHLLVFDQHRGSPGSSGEKQTMNGSSGDPSPTYAAPAAAAVETGVLSPGGGGGGSSKLSVGGRPGDRGPWSGGDCGGWETARDEVERLTATKERRAEDSEKPREWSGFSSFIPS
jgi:hypothetical protein